ncbi:MAG: MFS transporter [Candidatus Rokubacteria bacterium]|nr:MFS transporter [Candidatus Rokubacteria bacterium]
MSGVPSFLATAVGISVAAHLAVYAITPVLSLHLTALGGTTAQIGLLFSTFSIVAVALRPAAGAWIDRQGTRGALLLGATVMVLSSLGLQVATAPAALIGAMAGFGVGFGLTTMASVVQAASGPAEQRGRSLGVYYLAAPVSMAMAAPLGLWLFREVGAGATFAMVTVLGLAAAAFGFSPALASARRVAGARGASPLWSRGAVPLSLVIAIAAMGQSALYAFLPLHAAAHGQAAHLTWFFGVYSGGMIAFRIVVSTRADRWGRASILMPALALLALGFGVLTPSPVPLRLAVAAVLLAAGSSALYPTLVALVVDRVPAAERGVAMGMVSGAWDLGVFAGSLSIAAVVGRFSYGAAFASATALTVIALATLVVIERRGIGRRST